MRIPLSHDCENGFFGAHLRCLQSFHQQVGLDLINLGDALQASTKEAASSNHIRGTLGKVFESVPLKSVDFVAAVVRKTDEPKMVEALKKRFRDLNCLGLHRIRNAAINPEKCVGIKRIQN